MGFYHTYSTWIISPEPTVNVIDDCSARAWLLKACN
ncbi:Uncharacterised protein [Klebsiella pneumoniae]|nr:Uncharacterised protein [Klebsiella pneumoniae]VFZ94057.1 Uncharacterised protein [Klebsiella pneumoniae]